MNKFFLTVFGIASLSFMVSCGNGESNTDEAKTQDEATTEQADTTETRPEETVTKEAENTGPLNADTVEPGDQIEGLTVISADHTVGRHFTVHFEGEISLKGNLQQNPMEYTNEFFPESSPIQVKISDETYDLFQSFAFENFKDLESQLSDEQKSMLESGQVVPMTITIANPVANLYFGSKGRRADGTCRFVKLQ
jgi:hypothetical protein